MSRRAASILVVALVSQAIALGGTMLVCRVSGRVLDSCCCLEKAKPTSHQLETACCCTVLRTGRPDVVATASGGRVAKERGPSQAEPVLAVPNEIQVLLPSSFAVPWASGPTQERRLYLALRHLII